MSNPQCFELCVYDLECVFSFWCFQAMFVSFIYSNLKMFCLILSWLFNFSINSSKKFLELFCHLPFNIFLFLFLVLEYDSALLELLVLWKIPLSLNFCICFCWYFCYWFQVNQFQLIHHLFNCFLFRISVLLNCSDFFL